MRYTHTPMFEEGDLVAVHGWQIPFRVRRVMQNGTVRVIALASDYRDNIELSVKAERLKKLPGPESHA